MANKITIEWVHEGFEAILCDAGTQAKVAEVTNTICSRANANNSRGGTGFDSGTKLGRAFGSQRALGFVYTTDRNSRIAEAEDKALSKAVSG